MQHCENVRRKTQDHRVILLSELQSVNGPHRHWIDCSSVLPNVRFGSLADILTGPRHVRFTWTLATHT